MTIKQRQNLLAYLGYYVGAIDGEWGSGSRAACTAFQRDVGITADGHGGPETDKYLRKAVANDLIKTEPVEDVTDINVGNKTGTFWDDIEFFDREEKLVRTVDEIRRRLGVPVQIVTAGGSGVRCEQHNANVRGATNSEHLYGRAADLHAPVSLATLKQTAEAVLNGTGGLGLYDWGIHVDTGKYSRWNG